MNTINSDLIRGNIDTIILRALYNRDRYGYDIINEIEQRSSGKYKLKQPTLYSCLNRLENQGFVSSYWGEKTSGGRRKYYTLTDMGKELFIKNKTDWAYSKSLIDNLTGLDDHSSNPHPIPHPTPLPDNAESNIAEANSGNFNNAETNNAESNNTESSNDESNNVESFSGQSNNAESFSCEFNNAESNIVEANNAESEAQEDTEGQEEAGIQEEPEGQEDIERKEYIESVAEVESQEEAGAEEEVDVQAEAGAEEEVDVQAEAGSEEEVDVQAEAGAEEEAEVQEYIEAEACGNVIDETATQRDVVDEQAGARDGGLVDELAGPRDGELVDELAGARDGELVDEQAGARDEMKDWAAFEIDERENTSMLERLLHSTASGNYMTKLKEEGYTRGKNIFTDEHLRADNYFKDVEYCDEDEEEELDSIEQDNKPHTPTHQHDDVAAHGFNQSQYNTQYGNADSTTHSPYSSNQNTSNQNTSSQYGSTHSPYSSNQYSSNQNTSNQNASQYSSGHSPYSSNQYSSNQNTSGQERVSSHQAGFMKEREHYNRFGGFEAAERARNATDNFISYNKPKVAGSKLAADQSAAKLAADKGIANRDIARIFDEKLAEIKKPQTETETKKEPKDIQKIIDEKLAEARRAQDASVAKPEDKREPKDIRRIFEEKLAGARNQKPLITDKESAYVPKLSETQLASKNSPEFFRKDQIQIRNFKKLQESAASMGDDIKIRTYEDAPAKQFNEQFYYYSNKLKLRQYFLLFSIILIEVVLCYVAINLGLRQTIYAESFELNLYIAAVLLGMCFPLAAFFLNWLNPNKRRRISQGFRVQMLFSVIATINLLLIVYFTNVFFEMPLSVSSEYYVTLILPSVMCLNLPLNTLIFHYLKKSKRYAV